MRCKFLDIFLSFFLTSLSLAGCMGRGPGATDGCEDCPSGTMCDASRDACARPCNANSDCGGGATCQNGFCWGTGGDPVSCQNQADCDDGDPCNGVEQCVGGSCRVATTGLQADGTSCGGDKECIAHACTSIECGNGVVNTGEECDNGAANSMSPNACRPTCELPKCGDGVVDSGEVCDEGNTEDGPTCSADCQTAAECGDGIVHEWASEQCDFSAPTAGCVDCILAPGFGCDDSSCFGVIYVDAGVAGGGDGQSWATAYNSLQHALEEAYAWEDSDARPQPKEIWLAKGRYVPPLLAGHQNHSSFFLVNGVDLYGGFAGWEGQRALRDPQANRTILSGDVDVTNNKDILDPTSPTGWTAASRTDNRLHVVWITAGVSVTLDGLTIANGHADPGNCDVDYNCRGGGVLLTNHKVRNPASPNVISGDCPDVGASATFRHVIFEGNYARSWGGALDAWWGAGACPEALPAVMMEHVVVRYNHAPAGGGVHVSSAMASMEITNALFEDNAATYLTTGSGGAVRVINQHLSLRNAIFSENTAEGNGGAMLLASGGSATIVNTVFFANEATSGAGLYANHNSDWYSPTVLWNTTFANNVATDGGALRGVDSCDVTLYNSIVWNNGVSNQVYFPDAGSTFTVNDSLVETSDPLFVDLSAGDLRLTTGSPAINTGDANTDSELFVLQEGGSPMDLDGNPRFVGGRIDMGAYEYQE